jgi:hypothetical protein
MSNGDRERMGEREKRATDFSIPNPMKKKKKRN